MKLLLIPILLIIILVPQVFAQEYSDNDPQGVQIISIGNYDLEIKLPASDGEEFGTYASFNESTNFQNLREHILDNNDPLSELEFLKLEISDFNTAASQKVQDVQRWNSNGEETLQYGIEWTYLRAFNDMERIITSIPELVNDGMSLESAFNVYNYVIIEPEIESEIVFEEDQTMSIEEYSITVTTDKASYSIGDTITITGEIKNSKSDIIALSIKTISPNGNLLDIGQTSIEQDGTYSYIILAEGALWKSGGKYTVQVGFESDNLFETHFFIDDIIDDVSIEPEIDESNLYQCEAEACIDACNEDPNCTTSAHILEPKITFPLPFVDTSKDPQTYIDRYNNEPEYKKWFDTNYPDFTIYQAVGLSQPIPEWVKGVFAFYANGQINDEELKDAIKFLVNEGVIILD